MGKSSPSQPAAPDPYATAAAQGAADKESAITSTRLSAIDQVTPYGNLTYTETAGVDGTPKFTATQTLSPEQQQLYDLNSQASIQFGEAANQQFGAVSDALSSPLDYSSLGAAPTINQDVRQQTADAMYARINPQLQADEDRLRTMLANRGINDPNSDAYKAEMDAFNRQVADTRLAIDAQAGNEMAMQYQLQSAERDRAINEMVQQRQIPLNEAIAMVNGSQVQGPSFVGTPSTQVASAPVADSIYGSSSIAANNYAQDVSANNAALQGLFGLGSAGLQAGGYYFGG